MKSPVPDPIDVAVGQAIRRVRKLRQMTQGEVGHAIGVSFQQFQKYELGKNRISASMLVRTADALSVHAVDLLPEADAPGRPGDALSNLSRGALELLQAYDAIRSVGQRKALLNLAVALGSECAVSRHTRASMDRPLTDGPPLKGQS